MKKPFKVLSSTALAAVFASSALIPGAVFAAEAPVSVEKVVVSVDGVDYEIDAGTYAALKSEDYFENKTTKVKYVQSTSGTYFDADRFASVKAETESADAALTYLESKPEEAKTVTAGKIEIGPTGPVVTPPVVDGDFEVIEIAAINETSVEVTFPSDSAIDEEGLVAKTITLTGGDEELTATYSEKSLDSEGKATFTLTSGEKLVDTVTYTVTGEGFTEAQFIAKVGGAKIAEFVKVTEAVPATVKEDGTDVVPNTHASDIKVSAKDQYGDAIAISGTVEVEGTLNGMPLANPSEISISSDEVTVTGKLVAGDTLDITVISKDASGKEVAKSTLTYDVAKAAAPVVTTIELKTEDNKTSVPSGDSIVFTAETFDQFKSPVTHTASDIRWVVNGKAQTETAATFTLDETTPGEYKVQAFSTKNSKVVAEKTVTIGAAELTSLDFAASISADVEGVKLTANKYNNEDLVLGTITPNEGAALVASNINFHVTTTNPALSAADLTVTAEEVTDKNGKKVIVFKGKTTKAGSFQVTPYVGDSVTAEKVAKVSSPIAVATTINPTVATIGDVAFDAAELKTEQDIYKEVVLKNKHGEVLTKAQADVSVSSSNGLVTASIEQGDKDLKQDETKTYLKVNATEAATSVITLQKGEVVKTTTVKFVAPTLTTIKVADSKISDVVAGDQEAGKYKLTKVSYLDQDGKDMAISSNATITVKDSKGDAIATASNLVSFTAAKEVDGKLVVDAQGAKQDYLKVTPKANVAKGTYTVELKSTVGTGVDAKDITTSFQVVVGEARAAKNVEVTAKSTAVTVLGTTELTIAPKDQYGEFILVNKNGESAPEFNITGDDFVSVTQANVVAIDKDGNTVSGTGAADLAKIVAYKVEVTGAKIGTGAIKVEVLGAAVNGVKPVLATASQSITVDSVGKLVTDVEITETELQNTNADSKIVTLEAIGKDAAGNNVAINDTDLTWSIKSVKDAEGNVLKLDSATGHLTNAKGEYLVEGGKFEAPTSGTTTTGTKVTLAFDTTNKNELKGSVGLTVEVEVQVATANNKTATSVVKFDGEGSKYVSGLAVYDAVFNIPGETSKTVASKDLTDGGLKISFTKDQVNEDDGTIDDILLTFTGVDQYGKPMVNDADPKKGTVSVTATSDNRAAVTVTETAAASTITLKAVSEGVATVYAKAGDDTIEIEVTVSKEVAQAIQAGKDAAATATATNALTAQLATAKVHPFSDSAAVGNYKSLTQLGLVEKAVTVDIKEDSQAITDIFNKPGIGDALDKAKEDVTFDEVTAYYIQNTIARYLGALERSDNSTIKEISYKGTPYSVNGGALKGSNWKDAKGNSLVSAIVSDFTADTNDKNFSLKLADENNYSIDVTFEVTGIAGVALVVAGE